MVHFAQRRGLEADIPVLVDGEIFLCDDSGRVFKGTLSGNEQIGTVPPGGTTGQMLAKIDGSDYNDEWIDQPPPTAHAATHATGGGDDLTPADIGALPDTTTGVTAGTYGDSTHIVQIIVNATGQITSAVEVAISGGGGAIYAPLTNGDPSAPEIIFDSTGAVVMAAIT